MFGICHNHPFHNGNKRTALMAGVMHLDFNGYCIVGATNDQLYDLMLNIAKHDVVSRPKLKTSKVRVEDEVRAITDWLRNKSRKTQKGERQINFGELYKILSGFGYRLGDKRHNMVELLKEQRGFLGGKSWNRVTKIGCPGDSRSVNFPEIKRIREELKLTEEDGVDTQAFYGDQIVLDSHIRDHRQVLRRLAKT